VTLAIGEMKRELRIWRDHYWDYLAVCGKMGPER
jgi:hypothetical protein